MPKPTRRRRWAASKQARLQCQAPVGPIEAGTVLQQKVPNLEKSNTQNKQQLDELKGVKEKLRFWKMHPNRQP